MLGIKTGERMDVLYSLPLEENIDVSMQSIISFVSQI